MHGEPFIGDRSVDPKSTWEKLPSSSDAMENFRLVSLTCTNP